MPLQKLVGNSTISSHKITQDINFKLLPPSHGSISRFGSTFKLTTSIVVIYIVTSCRVSTDTIIVLNFNVLP